MSSTPPAPAAPDTDALLRALDAHLQAMPPVAALRLRIAGYDGTRLSLRAPLEANVNDKGCAFGGSLASLMTLAGWGLATLQLQAHGLDAAVYVADSQVRYLAPVYQDLDAAAWLGDGGGDGAGAGGWDAVRAELRAKGRAGMVLQSQVAGAGGTAAASGRARYVAILRTPENTAG